MQNVTKHYTEISQNITQNVADLYNQHPFPAYPIWAKIRWSEAYTLSPSFSRCLLRNHTRISKEFADPTPEFQRTLVIGSGDTQPLALAHWLDPLNDQLVCNDLALTNLRRLKRKITKSFLMQKRPLIQYEIADINEYLAICRSQKAYFHHIESYGVLHHLAAPSKTVELLTSVCTPGTCLRIMVYNPHARAWITDVAKAFRILQLSAEHPEDLALARSLLKILAAIYPNYYGKRLKGWMLHRQNHSRFIDAFFHPRVVSWDYGNWLKCMESHGFTILGLFDRNAELDDLPNPLWTPPRAEQIRERARDFRFENNFEMFFTYRPSDTMNSAATSGDAEDSQKRNFNIANPFKEHYSRVYSTLRKCPPPQLWGSYKETIDISPEALKKHWIAFLEHILLARDFHSALPSKNMPSLQRLARIGAILPSMIRDDQLYAQLLAPSDDFMLGSDYHEGEANKNLQQRQLDAALAKILARKGIVEQKRLNLARKRLTRKIL